MQTEIMAVLCLTNSWYYCEILPFYLSGCCDCLHIQNSSYSCYTNTTV